MTEEKLTHYNLSSFRRIESVWDMEFREESSGTELADISPVRDVGVTEEKLTHYNLRSFR